MRFNLAVQIELLKFESEDDVNFPIGGKAMQRLHVCRNSDHKHVITCVCSAVAQYFLTMHKKLARTPINMTSRLQVISHRNAGTISRYVSN